MKRLILFFLVPLQVAAQDITGLWKGFIHTSEKDLPYELAISENNGKLSGYSHTTFILNGVEEVGVKAVTIKSKNGNVLVEDDALVFNDFSEAPVKRVKQLDILTLIVGDTAMLLNGTFKTNIVRGYRSITGTIQLRKIDTAQKTKILPKLNELNLLNTLSFLQPKAKEVVAMQPAAIEKIKNNIPTKKEVATSTPLKIKTSSPVLQPKEVAIVTISTKEKTPEVNPETSTIKKDSTINTALNKEKRLEITSQPKAKEVIATTASQKEKNATAIFQPKPKETAIVITPLAEKKSEAILQPKPKQTANIPPPIAIKKSLPESSTQERQIAISKAQPGKKAANDTVPQIKNVVSSALVPSMIKSVTTQPSIISAAELSKRKTEMIQNVFFKSDSLLLSLYDNGEVDGDTVSVVLNGKVIIASQGLSTKAITKTIYITPDLGDSLQLVMYAENLGSIPPNTGLLILQDGKDRYEIRFAGDFQKNSAIILRRRKS